MLLAEAFLVCLSCASDAEVDGLVAKAAANGGRDARPAQDIRPIRPIR